MKYKVLFPSLVSIMTACYGGDTDWVLEIPFATPHVLTTINDAQDEVATTLSKLEYNIGGNGAINTTERLQMLIGNLNNQASSLDEAISTLRAILVDIPGDDLATKITYLAQANEKEELEKYNLMKTLRDMRHKQDETAAFLLSLQDNRSRASRSRKDVPLNLSQHQQNLLPHRDRIGDTAWKLLGGTNGRLAAVLSNAIESHPGRVEVSSVERNSFTLSINGKGQDRLYKF